jgi:acyl transferase domain-containing protein
MTMADRFAGLSPLKRALLAVDELKTRLDAAERGWREPVAIVGLGCRMPEASGPDTFWELLRDGRSPNREVPAERWDVDAFYDPDPDAVGRMSVRTGAFLEGVDLFDPQLFGIAPREAITMDPQQRLLLEVSWEALEHAGIAPDSLSGSATGVFVGITSSDYVDLVKHGDLDRVDAHFASGVAHSIASGRLSYVLGLQGPAVSIDTACSSSLVAVHLACQSLLTGECRMALAGGVNLILTPDSGVVFTKSRMLAPDGRCKTFDAAADGFGRGEGCVVVVLKRLADAAADGDRVLALVRGSAVNQDGPSSGLTAPNGPAQEAVVRAAIARAGIAPADVDVIEAHGTGTPLGDPIEVQALASVFRDRPAGRPLAVGSVKTNVGHLEAAAGISGLLKVVLALQHEAIPPHLHLRRLNPHVDWRSMPIEIPTRLTPWPRGARRRIAGVSSFGFSGTNAHVILEEAPSSEPEASPIERSQHLVTVSARSTRALAARVDALVGSLETGDAGRLADIAFTANAGRAQLAHRVSARGANTGEVVERLRRWRRGESPEGLHHGVLEDAGRRRVGFLFTGQGAQYVGMGRGLFETQPVFRRTIETCDAILRAHMDRPLVSGILYPGQDEASPIDETACTQPALFAVDYALAELWRSWGIEPAVLMGHSLGEYVAACVAGVLSLEDALMLVAARGRLMQALPRDGGMAVVFAPEDQVAAFVAGDASRLAIAAINEPAQTVVSGDEAALSGLLARCADRQIRSRRLPVSHAFHSPLMEPMVDPFAAVVARVTFSPPRIPVMSNVTGTVVDAAEFMSAAYWTRHVLASVRFADGVVEMARRGVDLFVEAGPHPTLLGLAARCLPDSPAAWIPSLRKGHDDWDQMLESLGRVYVGGGRVDWVGFDRGYSRRRVALPTYPFERERYWITDIAPASRRAATDPSHHPLLGRPLRSPALGDTVFEASLDRATHAWIFDHRVHDTVILPGAAFVEMGLAAAAAIWGEGPHAIDALALHAALTLNEPAPVIVQVVVGDAGRDRRAFRVYSAEPDAGEPAWRTHAEGTLVRAVMDGDRRADESIEAIAARCPLSQDPDALYRDLASRAIDLGPAFRGITRIAWTRGEALTRIEIPAGAGQGRAYRVHPVLLDNAIQTLAAAFTGGDDASYVPVGVAHARASGAPGRAAWGHARLRGAPDSDAAFIEADVWLRDDAGRVLVALDGLRLARADRAALRRGASDATRDWLYEITWDARDRGAPAEVSPVAVVKPADLADAIERRRAAVTDAQDLQVYDEALPAMEDLSAAYVVDALMRLGWSPSPGGHESASGLAARLGIVGTQQRLVGRLLEILGEVGVLRRSGDGWDVVATPEPLETAALFGALQVRYGASLGAELALLGACGPHLAGVLRGAVNPLDLLFPGGSSEMAEALYQASPAGRAFSQLMGDALAKVVAGLPEGGRIRILEIGGGTGATSSAVLPVLPPGRAEYVFTDISPAFTSRAARKFAAFPFIDCQVLDIERDPAAQGFAGRQFDVVIAANVLHATRDLGETFAHVRSLLAPGGLLVLLEILGRQRWIDLTFGLTDGWWRFTDRGTRATYPLLDRAAWLSCLEREGFKAAAAAPATAPGVFGLQAILLATGPGGSLPGHWVVLADEGDVGRRAAEGLDARGETCVVLRRGDAGASIQEAVGAAVAASPHCKGVVHAWALDGIPGPSAPVEALAQYERDVCGGVLDVVRALTVGRPAPLTLVTRGAQPVTAASVTAAPAASVWGTGKAIALEHPELRCRRIDLDPRHDTSSALVEELLAPDREDQVGFRSGVRHVARLVRRTTARERLPGVYRLESSARGTLDRLALVPATRRAPGPGEVEIAVEMTALNFADVMDALGVRPGGAAEFGGECVGVVAAIGAGVEGLAEGDEVVAVAGGCYATHVTCPAVLVVPKPASLSAAEAASLPIASITARYALQDVARLERGERVLIHAAAGGVGLMAVQLAQRIGAEVFATAGSPEKRAWLAGLGVRHVMDSRTTDFAREIREWTDGAGVHVVLNSLAGDFIAPSIDALAPGGRFVEIGKTGWSPERVAAYRADVSCHIVDWGPMIRVSPGSIRSLLQQVLAEAERGLVRPPPLTMFEAADARSAFRFMAQAQHIGKIIVRHARPVAVRSDATYLVTGGLSGLGLLVAERLVERGARSLVLMGRRGAATGAAPETIARIEASGAHVTVVVGDVSRAVDVDALFDGVLPALPPLRGIVHAAGVLDDGVLGQLDRERFERVMAPKVLGAALLDGRSHARPLDFFILFSSVASVLGSPGQANHSAANACLDALAYSRRARGLAASSINWGAWSDVGAAVRHQVGARAARLGVGTIDPAAGLAVFESVIECGPAQLVVLPVNWARYAEQFAAGAHPALLSELFEGDADPAAASGEPAPERRGGELWRRMAATPEGGRPRLMLEFVREHALRVLGLRPTHALGTRQPLNELGLDSLMAVELRNSLAASLGCTLPATLLFDYPTIEALSQYLAQHGPTGRAAESGAETPASGAGVDRTDRIDRIEQLSDDDVDRLLAERLAQRQGS